MNDFALLGGLKSRLFRNHVTRFLSGSRLRLGVILLVSTLIWFLLFNIFWYGLDYIQGYPVFADRLISVVLNLLFLAMVLMLCFSNGIIAYISLFKSKETRYLLSSPLGVGSTFLYKLTETIAFSSWAFLFLAGPLLLAYGLFVGAPIYFYLLSIPVVLFLLLFPAVIGSLVAIAVARWLPRNRGTLFLLLVAGASLFLFGGIYFLYSIPAPDGNVDSIWLHGIMSQLEFASHPLLPSAWATRSLIHFGGGEFRNGLFFLGVLLSNALAITMGAFYFSEQFLKKAWIRNREFASGSRGIESSGMKPFLSFILKPFPSDYRTFLRKDLISFARDPAQWSQFFIFFGLLALYFFNLRKLNYHVQGDFLRISISFLNLGATGLTLASFTSRFVYPQISLEGRRFWLIGVAPVERKKLIFAKYFFSLLFSTTITLPLIFVSVTMLNLSMFYILLELYSMLVICSGLSALAIGTGTLYPDMEREDPSKIVSGYGGTMNLVLSMGLVISVLVIGGMTAYLHQDGELGLSLLAGGSFVGLTIVGLLTTWVPLHLGTKAARSIEL